MDRHIRPVRATDVHWRSLEEGGVLVRLSDQNRFSVDEVGLVLWDRCDGMHDVEDLVSLIVRLFEVGMDRAVADVEGFLRSLEQAELVKLCEGPEAPTMPAPETRPADELVLI